MLKTLLFIVSAIMSALICGFTLITVTAASLTLCTICWLSSLSAMKLPTWYVVNDPEKYNPLLISQALEKALCKTLQSGNHLILHISNPGLNAIRLEINPGGELKVSDARRSITVESGPSWIPDHPLPLILKAGARSTLVLSPLPDQRIRVCTSIAPATKQLLYFLLPPLILLMFLDINTAATTLTAALLHTALNQRFGKS